MFLTASEKTNSMSRVSPSCVVSSLQSVHLSQQPLSISFSLSIVHASVSGWSQYLQVPTVQVRVTIPVPLLLTLCQSISQNKWKSIPTAHHPSITLHSPYQLGCDLSFQTILSISYQSATRISQSLVQSSLVYNQSSSSIIDEQVSPDIPHHVVAGGSGVCDSSGKADEMGCYTYYSLLLDKHHSNSTVIIAIIVHDRQFRHVQISSFLSHAQEQS